MMMIKKDAPRYREREQKRHKNCFTNRSYNKKPTIQTAISLQKKQLCNCVYHKHLSGVRNKLLFNISK
jgi:hypothetical protein